MSGERVHQETAGKPSAATHINSAGHTQKSAVDHLVDAAIHRGIANEYINSGDPALMAAAEQEMAQAARSQAVAENRAALTAGHQAAASRAIGR